LTATARGGEAWQAFGALVGQGKVAYVGSGNFAGWDIATVALAWLLHNPAVTHRADHRPAQRGAT
jgi:aryl-alcohol dehydrogenase-like predicted oxidoreductase